MPKSDLRLDILGASFSLTVDEDPLYLEALMSRYRRIIEKAQAATGLTDPLKTAITAGLLMCDEVEKLRSRDGSSTSILEAQKAEELTLDLIDRIDKIFVEKNI
ncbi:MAG: hypothetical protein Ta2B_12340 [Termitinemataceae bacterium]|nr:MAG: hypothetical protein Ta2B_12340 [Termitinemataceae bacterium]